MVKRDKPGREGFQPRRSRARESATPNPASPRSGEQRGADPDAHAEELAAMQFKVASLEQLLDVQERVVEERSKRLEQALTDLRREREQLQRNRRQTSSIVRSAVDAIVCFDIQGAVLLWNPQAEMILGWSREQVLGQSVNDLQLPLPHREGTDAEPEGMETLRLDERVEITATHRDGWTFPAELSVSRGGNGPEAIFSVFLRDITDRKEGQEHLAEARDQALAASRLKSEFLATMSHEVRTPMNGVVGMAELLLSTTLTPEQREYAQAIQGSAEALLAVLSDILDFSKIEADKLVLQSVPFDLRKVVHETTSLLAPQAGKKGLDLLVNDSPDGPNGLVGDPGRLRQILMNLLGNALKFTERGHVALHVQCRPLTQTTVQLDIAIEDTGIGIPRDKLAHIFGEFTQADASSTRRHGGAGLGLAIAMRLVEMMGGKISVESQLGQGATFRVSIPLPSDPDAAAAAPAPAPPRLAGRRVLVVDDNQLNRLIVCEQLARCGVETESVPGGQEALEALRAARRTDTPFEAALLDYQMPGMDGEQLARSIKADPSILDTVLVMLSSVVGQPEGPRMLRAGFSAVLHKPVHQSQLTGTLERVLDCGSPAPGPEQRATTPAAPSPDGSGGQAAPRPRVLVAEDSTVNQKVVTRMLEKLGCSVDLAANGKRAAEMAEQFGYDLIFMDCQMPEMDGFESTAAIRQRSAGHHIPIVALTANAMEGDRERCLQAGMDDYLSKPVTFNDLNEAVQRWMPAPARPRS